jgi:hypothetical protein
MNLKNYTSTVPAATSMGRIEKCLVEAGATDISKKYDNGICVSIRFRIIHKTPDAPNLGIPIFFELPAKVSACYKVLYAEVKRPNSETKKRVSEQAERTAWKIISDWVEIQLSMIQLEQAELLQVFLPYVFDPKTEQTFFDTIKNSEYKALLNN